MSLAAILKQCFRGAVNKPNQRWFSLTSHPMKIAEQVVDEVHKRAMTERLEPDPDWQTEVARAGRARFHAEKAAKAERLLKIGPEERRLTWDAIEMIRFLREDDPEEWTVSHLADGFSVSQRAIRNVLHGKFVPKDITRLGQDSAALANLGLIEASKKIDENAKKLSAGQEKSLAIRDGIRALASGETSVKVSLSVSPKSNRRKELRSANETPRALTGGSHDCPLAVVHSQKRKHSKKKTAVPSTTVVVRISSK